MKNKIRIAVIGLFMTTCVGTSYATILPKDKSNLKEKVAAMSEEQKKARLEEIRVRAEEIKSIDKSTLSRTERKALKKELREMNKESKVISGGVYLSVAAILIIILVLILVL